MPLTTPEKAQSALDAPLNSTKADDFPLVLALVHSDEGVFKMHWNIVPWLKTASSKEVIALSRAGWETGPGWEIDYASAAALSLEAEELVPAIAALLEYGRKMQDREDPVRFAVSIDHLSALDWLRTHRLDLYEAVI